MRLFQTDVTTGCQQWFIMDWDDDAVCGWDEIPPSTLIAMSHGCWKFILVNMIRLVTIFLLSMTIIWKLSVYRMGIWKLIVYLMGIPEDTVSGSDDPPLGDESSTAGNPLWQKALFDDRCLRDFIFYLWWLLPETFYLLCFILCIFSNCGNILVFI